MRWKLKSISRYRILIDNIEGREAFASLFFCCKTYRLVLLCKKHVSACKISANKNNLCEII